MEFSETISLVRGPAEPDYGHLFDIDQIYQQQQLQEQGLCATNTQARAAHQALLDAEAERIFEKDGEKQDRNKKLGRAATINSLKKEAVRYCHMCCVEDDCLDYALTAVKFEFGVLGGKKGSTRKKEAELRVAPQQEFGRTRGIPAR